jgi:signal transduction histidine kinase
MMNLREETDPQQVIYSRILISVIFFYIIYSCVFFYFEAWACLVNSISGLVLFFPICFYLVFNGREKASKIIFIVYTSFTVFFIAMTLNFEGGMQYYNAVTVIAIVILFDLKDRIQIYGLALFPAVCWFLVEPYLVGKVPVFLLFKNAPIETIDWLNKVGAFSLAVIFMIILINNLGKLKLRMDKKNEELLRLYDLFLRTEESAKIGSWQLKINTQELFWSDQTYKIQSLEIGTKVSVEMGVSFYHPEDQDMVQNSLERVMEREITDWQGDYRIINTKGDVCWVRVIGRGHFDENGSPIFLEGSIQDINEEKMADMAKDEFLATVSHEMRTPLMSVIGLSDVLLECDLDEEQETLANQIIEGGNAVLRIINDVLDLSKLKDNLLKLIPVSTNLESLVKEVSGILYHSADAKGIELKTNIMIENQQVLCDSVRVRQIMINLIGNAIKFTNEGEIAVTLREVSGLYHFTVKDTGCGINPDFIPQIFEPFEQDTQGKNFKNGTGLGMSITKRLVDLMGGTIDITSEINKGTTVNLNLEFEKDLKKVKKENQEIKKEAYFKGIRLLYVDDTLMNQNVVSRLLKKTECTVTLAMNGKEGYEKYVAAHNLGEPYDFILMDIQMPVMDGLESTREIRRFEEKGQVKRVPILAFSAFSFEEDKQNALKAGCDDHIGKPIRKRELISKIQTWVKE